MSRRKPKVKQAASGSPAWMTTFSDLMSLLLTFFILLFSMSQVSDEKFSAASQSLQSAFMMEGAGDSIIEGLSPRTTQGAANLDSNVPVEVQEMYQEMKEFIDENSMSSSISLSRDENGIYVDIQDSILFDSGKAELKTDGKETLELIAELLNKFDNRVIVEGHTDNIPSTSSRYPTNWELSTDRALSVLRFLSDHQNVAPSRLSAAGFGEHHPVVANDSTENRRRNRRVNIVLVHEPKEVKNNEE